MGLDLPGHHVADHDAAGLAVDHDQLEHLVPGVHRHRAGGDLALQRLVRADQQLLAGLAAGVEGAGDLHAAEGAVVQQSAVLPGERHALGDALVDDLHADLGQPVDVGLPGPEVAALDRVVEQPVDRVAVVAVVLGRVDAALGGDRVGPPRGVLVAEAGDLVAGLAQGGRRRGAGQAGADDDHAQLAPVGRVDQLGVEPALVPALLDRDRPAPWCRRCRRRRVEGVGVEGVDRPLADLAPPEASAIELSSVIQLTSSEHDRVRRRAGNRPVITPATAYASRLSRRRASDEMFGTERGQRAPGAVPQVEADRHHGDGVDDDHPPDLEAVDHPLVRLGRRPAGRDDVPGQVHQVVEHEQRDDDAAPAQGEGGVGPLHARPGPLAAGSG